MVHVIELVTMTIWDSAIGRHGVHAQRLVEAVNSIEHESANEIIVMELLKWPEPAIRNRVKVCVLIALECG